MQNVTNDFSEAIKEANEIFNIVGRILPVTNDEMTICAELENGMVVEEKDKIPEIVLTK